MFCSFSQFRRILDNYLSRLLGVILNIRFILPKRLQKYLVRILLGIWHRSSPYAGTLYQELYDNNSIGRMATTKRPVGACYNVTKHNDANVTYVSDDHLSMWGEVIFPFNCNRFQVFLYIRFHSCHGFIKCMSNGTVCATWFIDPIC